MLTILKDTNENFEVSNEIIGFNFIKNGAKQGIFTIYYKNHEGIECSLQDCFSCINFFENQTKTLISCRSSEFSFENKVDPIHNEFGKGYKIQFTPKSSLHNIFSFNIQFTIYEKSDFLLIKLVDIEELNQDPKPIHSIAPLTIVNRPVYLASKNSPSNLQKISWFKNGWQSWSPCKVLFGNEKDRKGVPIKMFRRILDNQDYIIKGRFYSEYCTVITDLISRISLILGFITLKDQFTRIVLNYEQKEKMKMLTAFGCMDGLLLPESSINSSEELLISFQENNLGYYGLINYAKVVKAYIKEDRISDIPIGWCSWYLYFTKITQDDMIQNLNVFKKYKEELPIDFIQLDDGYQKAIGDYNIINEKFPQGLYWLFDKIKTSGYKTGIWTGPFFAVKNSQFFQNHPDWFLTRITSKKNKLLKTTYNWGAFLHGLDLSNKEVIDYLSEFFKDLSYAFETDKKEPIINFFKIDFLHAAAPLDGKYKDNTYTRAQLIYRGVKAIRDGITDRSFLLGCGAPLGPCVGLVDAMRIGTDTAPKWKIIDKLGEKYGFSLPSLKRGLLPVLYRSFMHKNFWINDPDCLMIRRNDTKLNYDEIQLQITIFGLSGGQLLLSDNMAKLSKEEIDDAKLVIPPYNPPYSDPIPSDLFYNKYPSIYMLETNEVIGKRYLCAIINWEDKAQIKNISVSEIVPKLPPEEQMFLIYNFWEKKLLGVFKRDEILTLEILKPHSCQYLLIIPVKKESLSEPLFLSSDLHITQGCKEITQYKFIKEENKILIEINLIGYRRGTILIKLPNDKIISKIISQYISEFVQIDKDNSIWKLLVEFKNKIAFKIILQ